MDPQNTYATSYGEIIIKVIILKILENKHPFQGLLTYLLSLSTVKLLAYLVTWQAIALIFIVIFMRLNIY